MSFPRTGTPGPETRQMVWVSASVGMREKELAEGRSRMGRGTAQRRTRNANLIQQAPHVRHRSLHRGGGDHRGAHLDGAAVGAALATDEVAVRGRGAELAT